MIHLEKITTDNVWAVTKLKVSPNQENFVAPNLVSLAEAYAITSSGFPIFPLAIYDDHTLVGFTMISYGKYEEDDISIAPNNYGICRLMIAQEYQHQGYGRSAMEKILEFIQTFPAGKAEYCFLSYEPENTLAQQFYASFNFEDTDLTDHGELVMTKKLQPKVTEVVAALIIKEGKFLIGKRPDHKSRGGLYEFIGGKVEPNETKEDALIRECEEEIGVKLQVNEVFCQVAHKYPDMLVELTLLKARIVSGYLTKKEHSDLRWVYPSEIPNYQFCPADKDILALLQKKEVLS